MNNNTKTVLKLAFGAAMIILGLIFNTSNIGNNPYLGFGSLGTYLIYVGVLSLIIMVSQRLIRNKRKVDERMLYVASKASRITVLALIYAAFILIIADGITPIQARIGILMSYLVCGLLLVYTIAYRMLLKYN